MQKEKSVVKNDTQKCGSGIEAEGKLKIKKWG